MEQRSEGEVFFSKLLGQELITVIDDGQSLCSSCAYYSLCGNRTIEKIRIKYETGSCIIEGDIDDSDSYEGIHFEIKQVIYEIPKDLLEIMMDVEYNDYMTNKIKERLILLLIESEYNKHK